MHRFLPVFLIFGLLLLSFFYLPLKRQIVYSLHISGDSTTSCCDLPNLESDGSFEETASQAVYDNRVIDYPKTSLAQSMLPALTISSQVLGTTASNGKEKWIDVNLAEQKLTAWEGDQKVMEFLISSGKWFPTPKGEFNIWYKTRAQRMKGGSPALGTFYDLPNVPSNMFFYQGFAIHGAYWHNNFGHPMSHGCVNAPLANVKELFEWTGPVVPEGKNVVRATAENPGTRVVVH